MNTPITADVAVIGGGPAGLTATTALANDISLKVLVLERESAAGGIPRHCDHHGYGVRDMKTNLDTGDRRIIECDTLVLTGDWIPDHELARAAGLAMDPKTQGPLVDTASRTSRPGVFAIGNLLHPVDTADIAALDGRHVAEPVRAYLHGQTGPSDGIRILAEPPLRWISPGILRPGDIAPARNRLMLWTDTLVRIPRIVIRQDGNVIARKSLPWPASPGRVFRVPASVLDKVNAHGGPVTLSLGINGGSKHRPTKD